MTEAPRQLCSRALLTLAGIAVALVATAAQAQSYPDRPIKIVVGFPAGSGADTLVRFFSAKLAAASGGTVVVDNRPGVAGNIGSDLVAKSKADGYTILMNPASSMAGNPHIYKPPPFDVQKDLVVVASLMNLGFILTIGPDNRRRKPSTVSSASWRRAAGNSGGQQRSTALA